VRGATVVPARVAWAGEDRVGLEFHYMIDEQEVLVHITRRAQPKPRASAGPASRRLCRRISARSRGPGRRGRDQSSRRKDLRGRHGRLALEAIPAPFTPAPCSPASCRSRRKRRRRRVAYRSGVPIDGPGRPAPARRGRRVGPGHGSFDPRLSRHDPLELPEGSDVWLRLPGLEPCHAVVAWSKGNFVGCRFERPLHPAVLDMIVRKTKGR